MYVYIHATSVAPIIGSVIGNMNPISVKLMNVGIGSIHMYNCYQIQYGCLIASCWLYFWVAQWWPGSHTLNKHWS